MKSIHMILGLLAVTLVTAGVLTVTSDDSDAEVAYSYTSGNCTVDLETIEGATGYNVRVYKTPGAPDGRMTDYETTPEVPWNSLMEQIKSVVFEEGVTHIGGRALYKAINLTSVSIPDTVSSVGYTAFYQCTSLIVPLDSDHITVLEGHAFRQSGVTSVNLSLLESAGEYAFEKCPHLESVTNLGKLESMSEYMFSNCDALSYIAFPDTLTSIGNEVFYLCDGLDSIIIPGSVTSIGISAFQNSSVKSVKIEGTDLTNVSTGAFQSCPSLTYVDLGNSKVVGGSMFSGCRNLSVVKISPFLTAIPQWTFRNCTSLESIIIPESITTINSTAFEGCDIKDVLKLNRYVLPTKGFENATITDHFQSSAVIEQSEIKDVVIGQKTDAASRMLLLMPVVMILGLLVWFAAPYLRRG